MGKRLDDIEFVLFDTETTGLDPEAGDRVVEIAGIKFRGGARIAQFQSLVNPRREISEAAFRVNQITPEMLSSAPQMQEVMPRFLEFIKGSCLCSYNAAFDLAFLNNELKVLNAPALEDVVVIDILRMSRRLLPGLERYALWFVADILGIRLKQEHRAFSDVELTLQVFSKLKDTLEAKGISDFQDFSHLFNVNRGRLNDINSRRIAKIQEAMGLGVRLKIKYFSGSAAQVSEREVIPKEIRQEKNKSYLVGHCCLRNEERTFRIDGILHLEIV
jgi:DNA polymerase-3 subunit alpha (Gram-positive type)